MKALILLAGILGLTLIPAAAEDLAHTARIPDDERDVAQAAADDFRGQRYEDAAAKYKAIIAAHPDCLYAWSNLGVVRFQEGHLEEARQALEKSLALNPDDVFCLSNLGIVYFQEGRYNDAITALKSAIALQPENRMNHVDLEQAYEKAGRKQDAEAEKEKTQDSQMKF
jgi:tetratricopeptide (TPR) repeat protein